MLLWYCLTAFQAKLLKGNDYDIHFQSSQHHKASSFEHDK